MVGQEEPSFPLIDVPDADVSTHLLFSCVKLSPISQLDEEGIKEKKKQKLMKAGYEARVRARKEKEREREEKEREEKKEEEERDNDLGAWAKRLRSDQEVHLTSYPFCFSHTTLTHFL